MRGSRGGGVLCLSRFLMISVAPHPTTFNSDPPPGKSFWIRACGAYKFLNQEPTNTFSQARKFSFLIIMNAQEDF